MATVRKNVMDGCYPACYLIIISLYNLSFSMLKVFINNQKKDKLCAKFYKMHNEVLFCLSYTLNSGIGE